MKKFFHDYSYSIIKMFVNQFAIAIFGTALTFATTHAHSGSDKFDTLTLVVSIFSILFYLFLIYTLTWEIGAKDRISVDMGKKTFNPHLGLLLSAIANIPNIILAVLYMFADIFNSENAKFLFRLFASLLEGMYFGAIATVRLSVGGAWVQLNEFSITFFVIIIPALITCWVAYYLGFKNFRFIAPDPQKASTKPNIKK